MAVDISKRMSVAERRKAVEDAQQSILHVASQYKLLVFGEPHIDSRPNAFVASILADLRTKGFTHVGVEHTPVHLQAVLGYLRKEITEQEFRRRTHVINAYREILQEAMRREYAMFGFNAQGAKAEREQRMYELIRGNVPAGKKAVIVCGSDHALLEDHSPSAEVPNRMRRLGGYLSDQWPTYRVNLDPQIIKRAPPVQFDLDLSFLFGI